MTSGGVVTCCYGDFESFVMAREMRIYMAWGYDLGERERRKRFWTLGMKT